MNPNTPKYVGISNFLNKYSIIFDAPTIPTKTPTPNIPATIKL